MDSTQTVEQRDKASARRRQRQRSPNIGDDQILCSYDAELKEAKRSGSEEQLTHKTIVEVIGEANYS